MLDIDLQEGKTYNELFLSLHLERVSRLKEEKKKQMQTIVWAPGLLFSMKLSFQGSQYSYIHNEKYKKRREV